MYNSQLTVSVQAILQYIANIASKINKFQLLKYQVIENLSALQRENDLRIKDFIIHDSLWQTALELLST